MGKVLVSAGVVADGGPGVPLAVLGWGATAAGYLAMAASDELDDLIVTSRRAYHLVRQLDGGAGQQLLVYLRLDRARSNLAVARRALAGVQVAPASVPVPRDAAPKQEIPAQSGVEEMTSNTGRGTAVAVAVAAPPAARPALPRRHQVAALPLPRRPQVTVRAGPSPVAAGLPGPLPRRTAEAQPVAARGPGRVADPPSALRQRWADDVSTMQRLLTALRRLR